MHASVFRVIPPSIFLVDLSSVGSEDALHCFQSLRSQFIAVAQEKCAFELARVRDPVEQVDCNEGLARAGRKRQQRAWWTAFGRTAGSLFEDRSNHRVLKITPLALAAGISREQRLGGCGFQREAHDLLVTRSKIRGRRKLRERPRHTGHACRAVELHEQMAVGGENELDVVLRRAEVALHLVQPMSRWQRVFSGLEQCDGDRLRLSVHANPQRIVGASTRAPARFTGDDLDRAVVSRRIRSSDHPRTWIAGSMSFARVSASERGKAKMIACKGRKGPFPDVSGREDVSRSEPCSQTVGIARRTSRSESFAGV